MSRTTLIILGVIGGLLVFGLMVWLLFRSLNPNQNTNPVTLEFWGVYDDPSYYRDAITAYRQLHPNVKINYQQISYTDYERQLVGAFANGSGPDIWLMHNTWLPKHGDKIYPLPATTPPGEKDTWFTINDFRDQFVDEALSDLTKDNLIYALPLYVDTLALYYNKELLNGSGIAIPPVTWAEFNEDVKKLTQLDSRGNIVQAGAAIGTATNVNRSTDILALLMLQGGTHMTDQDHRVATFSSSLSDLRPGQIALRYYTDFANPSQPVYTWNNQQHYSVDAFAEGRVAMMFNYSHQTQLLRQKAPHFSFALAPMPQIANPNLDKTVIPVNYANYWAPTVWKQSKNPVEAWRFLTYLSSFPGASKFMTASSRPPARRDLINQVLGDADLGVFAKQALSARSWYQVDSGAIEKIFADLIEAINYGQTTIADAVDAAENKVNVLMRGQ